MLNIHQDDRIAEIACSPDQEFLQLTGCDHSAPPPWYKMLKDPTRTSDGINNCEAIPLLLPKLSFLSFGLTLSAIALPYAFAKDSEGVRVASAIPFIDRIQ
jgi:hypothetical protein